MKNRLVTLFGGNGFIGNYVAQSLLARGARLRIASRHPEKSFSLKPLANLGQLQFARCDITRPESVQAAVSGADFVVNLVGAFDGNLKQLMGEAPGDIAAAAKSANVKALVHLSAIGADIDSDAEYAHAKAFGERRVLEEFPQAVILRPSLVFGRDDNFTNMFAQLIQTFPILPVFGPDSQLQPVFVDDVAETVAVALENPGKHGGKIFELGGPERITMMELHQRIAAAEERKRTFIPMPDSISSMFAAIPLTPMSSDQWTLLKSGNVVSDKAPGFKQLGIDPKPLGLFLDRWMVRYRRHGRFSDRMRDAAA